MDQASLAEWVGGFFDGEGCVSVRPKKGKTERLGFQISPVVEIRHTYVSGLFDAEGWLEVAVMEDSRSEIGYSMTTRASIHQTENDQLINRLQEFARAIGIESRVYHREGVTERHLDNFQWRVLKVDDVETFLEAIRNEVVVKQRQIDIMLDEIYPLLRAGKHLQRRGFLEIMAYRDVMNSGKGGRRGKYNLEYFEDLWGMSIENNKLPDAHPRNNGVTEAQP